MIKTRRVTIKDSLIDDELYFKILSKVASELDNREPTQLSIINILVPLNLSNATIARVVNDVIPTAKATAGSIAAQLKSSKRQEDLLTKLKKDIQMEW